MQGKTNMSESDGRGHIPKLYSVFNGEVASLQTYGAFIKIPGCKRQGLVHKSQMSIARIEDPSEMLAKGEKVHCKVIGMEGEGEKISLSMKVVNQTTGQDLDPNNVQLDQDAKKRRQWQHIGKDKIELGAELNTTCRRCGGHGHLTMDCFAGKDGTQYDLIPDLETLTALPPMSDVSHAHHKKKKKKKEKKKKKKKKLKKRKHSTSSSEASDSDEDSDTDSSDDEAGGRGRKRQDSNSHSHSKKHSQVSRDNDLSEVKRPTSDKQRRLSGSSSKNRHGDKKGERKGVLRDRSDDSSSSSTSPQRRRRSDSSVDHGSGGGSGRNALMKNFSSRSHDKRETDRRRGDRDRDEVGSDDSASGDSPSNKHRNNNRSRPEGQIKPLTSAAPGRDSQRGHHHHHSDSKHSREEQTRPRARRRSSSSPEVERVREGGKGHRGHTDLGEIGRARVNTERHAHEKGYVKDRGGRDTTYRDTEKRIESSRYASQRTIHERSRHRSRSRSREREGSKKRHRSRDRNSS